MDYLCELILKRFRVQLYLLLQCITTPLGSILHVAHARNHVRPVAAAIIDPSRVLVEKFEREKR